MTFAILVNNGSRYEYYMTKEAKSVSEVRKWFLGYCAPSQRDFKVRKITVSE